MPKETLEEINVRTGLVTHSIGSGSGGDIIFHFMKDICGDVENPPRRAKAFGDLLSVRKQLSDKLEKLREALDNTHPVHRYDST